MNSGINPALLDLAKAQFELAGWLCRPGCRAYHAAWGFLRAAKLVGGIDADRAQVSQWLSPLVQMPGQRVLIAACADSAQVALVRELAGGNAPAITVVDRCATPLAVCASVLPRPTGALSVHQSDLLDFKPQAAFDVIICHSLFPFLKEAERRSLLRLFSTWLAPRGRLVLVARVDMAPAHPVARERSRIRGNAGDWTAMKAERAIAVLDPIPQLQGMDKRALFAAVTGLYRFLADNPTPYASSDQLMRECVESGFAILQSSRGDLRQGYPHSRYANGSLGSVILEAAPDERPA